uniref:CCHC-type domain-containing protein n=1 Tax=Aegilops tauschii subsp. strangulata TaxID=200361 RepID=A0A453N166_AEGTS
VLSGATKDFMDGLRAQFAGKTNQPILKVKSRYASIPHLAPRTSPTAAPAPATTASRRSPLRRSAATLLSPPLSPAPMDSPAAPGRGRDRRWLESSPSSGDSARPSYRQALCGSSTAATSPASPPPPPRVIRSEIHRLSEEEPVEEREWLVAGRKRRRPPRRRAPAARSPAPPVAPLSGPGRRRASEEFCSRCRYHGHPRSECRRDIRCTRCGFYGHVARMCTNPRSPSSPSRSSPSPKRLRGPSPPRPSPSASSPSVQGSWQPASSGLAVPSPRASHAARSASPSVPLTGHPSLRPAAAPACFLPLSAEINDVEEELRRALLATVAGCRTGVSCQEVSDVICSRFGIPEARFSVHRHLPEDFLIRFQRAEDRALVANDGVRPPASAWSFTRGARLPVRSRCAPASGCTSSSPGCPTMSGTAPPRSRCSRRSAWWSTSSRALAVASTWTSSGSRPGRPTLTRSPSPPTSSSRCVMALPSTRTL